MRSENSRSNASRCGPDGGEPVGGEGLADVGPLLRRPCGARTGRCASCLAPRQPGALTGWDSRAHASAAEGLRVSPIATGERIAGTATGESIAGTAMRSCRRTSAVVAPSRTRASRARFCARRSHEHGAIVPSKIFGWRVRRISLGVERELLEELLAGPHAGELDLDVLVRRRGRESLIRSRARSTIFTGSPMSRTKISPPSPIAPACSDELARLGDGHEVALHLRVGDRDRAALGDLLLEDAGSRCRSTAEHVAEAHRDELRLDCAARAPGRTSRRRAWSTPMIDVGFTALSVEIITNVSTPCSVGGVGDLLRAEDVVLDRLAGVPLHHRHVLVRGGVEDDVRALGGEDRPRCARCRRCRRCRAPIWTPGLAHESSS